DRRLRLVLVAVGASVAARAAAGIGVLCCGEDGDGEAAALCQSVVEVPAAQDQVHCLVGAGAEFLALAEGDVEHTRSGEVVAYVEAGRTVVAVPVVGVLPVRALRIDAATAIVAQAVGVGLRVGVL